MKHLVLVVLLAWVPLAFPSERADAMVRTLVPPARIVAASGDALADSAAPLCGERHGQVSEGRFLDGSGPVLEKGNWLILDFGRELHGLLQIGSGAKTGRSNRVRVRFGESVAETMAVLVGCDYATSADYDNPRNSFSIWF